MGLAPDTGKRRHGRSRSHWKGRIVSVNSRLITLLGSPPTTCAQQLVACSSLCTRAAGCPDFSHRPVRQTNNLRYHVVGLAPDTGERQHGLSRGSHSHWKKKKCISPLAAHDSIGFYNHDSVRGVKATENFRGDSVDEACIGKDEGQLFSGEGARLENKMLVLGNKV